MHDGDVRVGEGIEERFGGGGGGGEGEREGEGKEDCVGEASEDAGEDRVDFVRQACEARGFEAGGAVPGSRRGCEHEAGSASGKGAHFMTATG